MNAVRRKFADSVTRRLVLVVGCLIRYFGVAIVGILLLGGESAFAAKMYLGRDTFFYTEIWRADLDGMDLERLASRDIDTFGRIGGIGLDLSSEKVYWGDCSWGASRADLDGSNVEMLLSSDTHALALDIEGGKMYLGEGDRRQILRADLDGSNLEVMVETEHWVEGIALDLANGQVFWEESGRIVRGKLTSREVDGTVVEGLEEELELTIPDSETTSLALDLEGSKIYFGVSGQQAGIFRADLDLTDVENVVTGGRALGITLDIVNEHVYWTGDGVWRANLDGTNVEHLFDGYGFSGIALDFRNIPDPVFGDANLDGEVNGLDVDPFTDVLINGPFQPEVDVNQDRSINGLDVAPFVRVLLGGGTQPIPEPSTLLLCIVALGVVSAWRKWAA